MSLKPTSSFHLSSCCCCCCSMLNGPLKLLPNGERLSNGKTLTHEHINLQTSKDKRMGDNVETTDRPTDLSKASSGWLAEKTLMFFVPPSFVRSLSNPKWGKVRVYSKEARVKVYPTMKLMTVFIVENPEHLLSSKFPFYEIEIEPAIALMRFRRLL